MFCIYCDVIICLYNHNDDVISTHFTQEAKKDLKVRECAVVPFLNLLKIQTQHHLCMLARGPVTIGAE